MLSASAMRKLAAAEVVRVWPIQGDWTSRVDNADYRARRKRAKDSELGRSAAGYVPSAFLASLASTRKHEMVRASPTAKRAWLRDGEMAPGLRP